MSATEKLLLVSIITSALNFYTNDDGFLHSFWSFVGLVLSTILFVIA